MASQLESLGSPSPEVITDVDLPADPLALPHAPVLIEGLCPLDAGLVVPRRLGNRVGTSVGGEGPQLGGAGGGIVGAEGLDNVVLD